MGEKSKIFTSQNPWMKGLYAILVEYLKICHNKDQEYDKNCEMEIQLVMK
jgi:hypothetical protein